MSTTPDKKPLPIKLLRFVVQLEDTRANRKHMKMLVKVASTIKLNESDKFAAAIKSEQINLVEFLRA